MSIHKIGSALSRVWLFVLSIMIFLPLVLLMVLYLIAYFTDDVVMDVAGNINTDFRVFYFDNSLYEENPIPQTLHFYLSLTDFIEIDSGFSLQVSDYVEIHYRYTATERLVIRYMASVEGTANPIMFVETRTLSEVSGHAVGSSFNLSGSTYMINPRLHIYRYLEVVSETIQQIDEHGVNGLGFRGLSADLFIDFTYFVQIPSLGISRTITRGYRLPLGMEVYTLSLTGVQGFNESVNTIIQELPFELTMPVVIVFVVLFLISAYCFFSGIKKLQADSNKHRYEAKMILKKYDNEIVISNIPLPLSHYTHIMVRDFNELLKLAINQNKHILCHHDNTSVEFAVIIQEHAYYYQINYTQDDDNFDEGQFEVTEAEIIWIEEETWVNDDHV